MSRTIKHAYTKAKAISKHCRNSSGKCYYCVGNRTYKNNKKKLDDRCDNTQLNLYVCNPQ